MGRLLGLRHRFFLPLWRRALTSAVLVGWSSFEFLNGATIWGGFFAVLAAITLWEFFVDFDPENYQ
ncbi:MAG: DUF3329 domain-containing protein [Pseudomonadota bacterium]